MTEIPLTNGFYESDSLPISNQECVNLRVNIPQTDGAWTRGALFGTEGINQLATSGIALNANRGGHVKDGVPYFVNGEILYRLDRTVDALGVETFTLANLGAIPGTDRVSFADNGKQLIVITGGAGWIMDESASPTIQSIVSAGFTANGTPEQVVFNDSFFVVTTDSKKFIRSAANDGLTWSALDFFTAETDPDDIVAPITHKGQLLIAGSETIQFYQNNAGTYQTIKGMIINKGVYAPFGIVNTSDSFMFVGGGVNESAAIWTMSGNSAQKISTTAIDAALSKMSQEDIQACFAWSFAQSGAYYAGFTFPGRCFVYDLVSQKWHERKSSRLDVQGFAVSDRWRVNSVVSAYNKIICGDSIDGRIGSIKADTYTEYGENIVRSFSTIPLHNQGDSFSIPNLELTMESGVGDAITDPQVRLSLSKDSKIFKDELTRGFGKIGEYYRRAIWRRLGRFARMAVFRFEISDPVKVIIIKLEARVSTNNGSF